MGKLGMEHEAWQQPECVIKSIESGYSGWRAGKTPYLTADYYLVGQVTETFITYLLCLAYTYFLQELIRPTPATFDDFLAPGRIITYF